jgi:hypothetical protein
MASWNPDLADIDELARRVARIRQQCDALDNARDTAARQRDVIGHMKHDDDAMYNALASGKPSK